MGKLYKGQINKADVADAAEKKLKDEALRWIRRVEYFEREGVLFRSESIWSKTN